MATLADEVASLFASLHDPEVFLVHDINFHRGVAAASGNPIVASLVEMVSALYYERRRDTAARASDRDLRDAARDAPADLPGDSRARRRDARGTRDARRTCSRPAGYQAQEPTAAAAPAAAPTAPIQGGAASGRADRRQH